MGEKEINCETGFIAEADWINWYMSALQKQYVHRGEIIYSKMPKYMKIILTSYYICRFVYFERYYVCSFCDFFSLYSGVVYQFFMDFISLIQQSSWDYGNGILYLICHSNFCL